MIAAYERGVFERFDALQARFKPDIAADDFRLRAIVEAIGPLDGTRLLDLGCGKGRFAAHLSALGAEVVGLDLSAGMLARAGRLARVRGSARRLPFPASSFDGLIAVEVFEHLSPAGVDGALSEARRVLRPGGTIVVVDKNAGALDAKRPWLPSLAVKWIDERRGRFMYPADGPVRERWFWPSDLEARMARWFEGVRIEYLLSPREQAKALFRSLPTVRLMALWTARVPGGGDG
jgi:2-polyprenyl-6-hydroxyphenyl methylase/3-demethylubiquinone-9 3-methyltransferase